VDDRVPVCVLHVLDIECSVLHLNRERDSVCSKRFLWTVNVDVVFTVCPWTESSLISEWLSGVPSSVEAIVSHVGCTLRLMNISLTNFKNADILTRFIVSQRAVVDVEIHSVVVNGS